MYRPAMFREDRLPVLHALIRSHPLATLVTAGEGGLLANPVPFIVTGGDANDGPGVLRAHIARASDQVAALRAGAEALVIFQGPEAYVSPAWYPSKAETGKVVPTWNYVVVQARGMPRVVEDPAWLLAQIHALTDAQERARCSVGEAAPATPWKVSDAPEAFIAAQLQAIVGIEIPIAAIEGKWKVSQNRPEADRHGVVDGLRTERQDRSPEPGRNVEAPAEAMATLVRDRGARMPGPAVPVALS